MLHSKSFVCMFVPNIFSQTLILTNSKEQVKHILISHSLCKPHNINWSPYFLWFDDSNKVLARINLK